MSTGSTKLRIASWRCRVGYPIPTPWVTSWSRLTPPASCIGTSGRSSRWARTPSRSWLVRARQPRRRSSDSRPRWWASWPSAPPWSRTRSTATRRSSWSRPRSPPSSSAPAPPASRHTPSASTMPPTPPGRSVGDWCAALPRGETYTFHLTSIVSAEVEQAMKPESIAFGVFGAIAALAALLIVGQAIARAVRANARDVEILRSLGAGPLMTTVDSVLGVLIAVILGGVLAAVVSVLLSPMAPMGACTPSIPHPDSEPTGWCSASAWASSSFVSSLSRSRSRPVSRCGRPAPHDHPARNGSSARRPRPSAPGSRPRPSTAFSLPSTGVRAPSAHPSVRPCLVPCWRWPSPSPH